MTIKSSGSPLSFSEIGNEFGLPNDGGLGKYRKTVSAGVYSDLPLDDGIPKSGPIKFSDFYGKSLNVVLDIGTGTEYRVNLKTKYDNGNPTVIGGYKSKPINTSGVKIRLSVNKTVGSAVGNQTNVALRTGTWNTGTILQLRIGGDGKIYGAGGKGGSTTFSESQSNQSGTQCFADGSRYFIYSRTDSGEYLSGPCQSGGDQGGCNFPDPTGPNGETAFSIGGFYPGSSYQVQYGDGYSQTRYQACRDYQYTVVNRTYGTTAAEQGSSAIGIDYPVEIQNYGYIQSGYGGGNAGNYADATQ